MSAATDKMRREDLPETAVETFARYEERLRAGEEGMVPEADIEPLAEVPALDELPEGDPSALEQTVVLKLNGGLGTSMGMTKAKSLLEVKDGLTFLDVIVRQLLRLREQHAARIPLLLMNSFATRDDTLAALERYPELPVDDLPLDFVQGRVPKLLADGHEPGELARGPGARVGPARPRRRVRLAGRHRPAGDSSSSAATATCSSPTPTTSAPRSTRASLGWFAAEGLPFVSEVVDRTESDKKGGHLARRREEGGLLLRETAQVSDEDQEAFENISVHRYFNANSIWVNLEALERTLDQSAAACSSCR